MQMLNMEHYTWMTYNRCAKGEKKIKSEFQREKKDEKEEKGLNIFYDQILKLILFSILLMEKLGQYLE